MEATLKSSLHLEGWVHAGKGRPIRKGVLSLMQFVYGQELCLHALCNFVVREFFIDEE